MDQDEIEIELNHVINKGEFSPLKQTHQSINPEILDHAIRKSPIKARRERKLSP
jgi:hypothetical protein